MSDDRLSVGRVGGARRLGPTHQAADVDATAPVARVGGGSVARGSGPSIPGFADTAEVLLSELGGSVDLLLFERLNGVLVSPAMSSMTHRANVLHSVVSWLEAQSSRLGEAEGGQTSDSLPWLGSVIGTLHEEIALIEAFHKGAVRDVESSVD